MACAEARLITARLCAVEGCPSTEGEMGDEVGPTRGGSALVAKVRNSGKSARMPVLTREVCGAVWAAAVLVCVLWLVGNGKRR